MERNELIEAERKLVGRLKVAEKMLMCPEHQSHPEGEEWYRKFKLFRGWIDQLIVIRIELVKIRAGGPSCPACGSFGWFESMYHGCYDCVSGERSRVNELLADRGYIAVNAQDLRILLVREPDTPVPDDIQASVRLTTLQLVRLAGCSPGAREQILNVMTIFPGSVIV
ncbi:MAG: hypothetical protein ACYC27_14760 [Armatimonadota bacterium]